MDSSSSHGDAPDEEPGFVERRKTPRGKRK
jgi:hypothetical protein